MKDLLNVILIKILQIFFNEDVADFILYQDVINFFNGNMYQMKMLLNLNLYEDAAMRVADLQHQVDEI